MSCHTDKAGGKKGTEGAWEAVQTRKTYESWLRNASLVLSENWAEYGEEAKAELLASPGQNFHRLTDPRISTEFVLQCREHVLERQLVAKIDSNPELRSVWATKTLAARRALLNGAVSSGGSCGQILEDPALLAAYNGPRRPPHALRLLWNDWVVDDVYKRPEVNPEFALAVRASRRGRGDHPPTNVPQPSDQKPLSFPPGGDPVIIGRPLRRSERGSGRRQSQWTSFKRRHGLVMEGSIVTKEEPCPSGGCKAFLDGSSSKNRCRNCGKRVVSRKPPVERAQEPQAESRLEFLERMAFQQEWNVVDDLSPSNQQPGVVMLTSEEERELHRLRKRRRKKVSKREKNTEALVLSEERPDGSYVLEGARAPVQLGRPFPQGVGRRSREKFLQRHALRLNREGSRYVVRPQVE